MRIIKALFILAIVCNVCWETAAQEDYFQQEVNYKIKVELNDVDHLLNGELDIEYINNSPDELSFIYFHLWPNAYKDQSTAFARQQSIFGDNEFFFANMSFT